jgi:hypothetical protein
MMGSVRQMLYDASALRGVHQSAMAIVIASIGKAARDRIQRFITSPSLLYARALFLVPIVCQVMKPDYRR